MPDALISKKELLEVTGISYGSCIDGKGKISFQRNGLLRKRVLPARKHFFLGIKCWHASKRFKK